LPERSNGVGTRRNTPVFNWYGLRGRYDMPVVLHEILVGLQIFTKDDVRASSRRRLLICEVPLCNCPRYESNSVVLRRKDQKWKQVTSEGRS
jgi:hypothetical protein